LVGPANQIFTVNEEDVATTPFRIVDTQEFSSDSAQDFANQISSELEVSGSYGDATFGQAFTASAQMSLERTSQSSYNQYRYDQIIKATMAHLSSKSLWRYDQLRPSVKEFLLTASPSDIHDKLGDFYATEVVIGGVFQVTVTTVERESDTKTEMQNSIKADMDSVVASASAAFSAGGSVSTTISSREMRTSVKAQGGDTHLWLGLSKDNMEDIKTDWAATLDDTNAFAIGFRLSPLWRLLEQGDLNPGKAKELETYMKKKWADEAAEVPVYHPEPDEVTPAPTPPQGTDFFKFRLKNSFSIFTSNADKAKSAATRAAGIIGVGIARTDDKEGWSSGFFFKVWLNKRVNHGNFLNAFKKACREEGLHWGNRAGDDINEA
jgi:hypothetical protein